MEYRNKLERFGVSVTRSTIVASSPFASLRRSFGDSAHSQCETGNANGNAERLRVLEYAIMKLDTLSFVALLSLSFSSQFSHTLSPSYPRQRRASTSA